jgi:hypothetical protein
MFRSHGARFGGSQGVISWGLIWVSRYGQRSFGTPVQPSVLSDPAKGHRSGVGEAGARFGGYWPIRQRATGLAQGRVLVSAGMRIVDTP